MTTNRFSQLLKPKNGHLASAQFDAYQDGVLSEADADAYRQHLDACRECQEWVSAHSAIAQQLRNESSHPAFLSPAAAARIQSNMSSRMRRALIMNNMKAALAATAVVAVLALVVGLFAWQTRNVESLDEAEPIAEIVTPEAQLSAPEATIAPEALNERLITAVKASDAPEVERLLLVGADPNALDSGGNALLPEAVRRGKLAIVEALVDAGADLEGTLFATFVGTGDLMELTALGWAAAENRSEMAQFLIARGADVNWADPVTKLTPLHLAAFDNQAGMIKLLLEGGADPDALYDSVEIGTPLHAAIDNGSHEAIQALLEGGANVDIQSPSGQTPLMYAHLKGGPGMLETTTILLEHGADPNLQNNAGNTTLHVAAKWDRSSTIPILVEHGASLDVQNKAGKTPLDVAVDDRIIELLQELAAEQQ